MIRDAWLVARVKFVMTSPVASLAHDLAFVACSRQYAALTRGASLPQRLGSLRPRRNYLSDRLLLIGRCAELVGRVAVVLGAYERQDFPQVVGGLDDGAERRHRTDDVLT